MIRQFLTLIVLKTYATSRVSWCTICMLKVQYVMYNLYLRFFLPRICMQLEQDDLSRTRSGAEQAG